MTAPPADVPAALDTAPAGDTTVPDDVAPPVDTAPAEDIAPPSCDTAWTVVHFDTSDGVTLEADYRAAESPGPGAVVLVHMVPPAWDRTSWPLRVRDQLHDLGLSVLSIDRRGAGASGGTAVDAYKGPGGRLDLEAAVTFLLAQPCAPAATRVVLIGASNGTTSTLDYLAGHDPALPAPAGLAWLSPGAYTENQTKLADLGAGPILWLYPDTEPWSETWNEGAPETWTFVKVSPGAHGTHMLDDGPMEATVMAALVPFVTAAAVTEAVDSSR